MRAASLGLLALAALLMAPSTIGHGLVEPLAPARPFVPTQFGAEAVVSAAHAPGATADTWPASRAGDYDVRFVCPAVVRNSAEAPACPSYLVDAEDVLGAPVLVVDPKHPGFLAFNALHGGPGPEVPGGTPAPSATARDNAVHQPHTTFQSRDGGALWDDNRYYARLDEADRIWGVDNAMGADDEGRLTIVSVYAVEDAGEISYKATITSSGRASQPVDYDRDYVVRGTQAPGAVMRDAHVVGFPAADAMVAMWLEGTGKETALRFLARVGGGAWTEPLGELKACTSISNPVVQGSRLLFLCQVIPGTVDGARGGIQMATVHVVDDVWQVDVSDAVPLRAVDNMKLADASLAAPGGVVAAAGRADDGKAHVEVAFGVVGGKWAPVRDYRDAFGSGEAGRTLLGVRVNALAFLATSGTVHMIIAETYSAPDGPEGSPFRKSYGVVHGGGRLLGSWSLGYGDPASRVLFPAHVAGLDAGVYDDAKDSIVVHQTPSGDQRAFIAFGDHGVVRYAEILELQPTPPAFPPISPASPVPVPLAGANPAIVAAVAGVLSTAAVARMAAAKKKKTAEAPSL